MKKLAAILLTLAAVAAAGAQAKELRVLLANHPYGDLLKAALPEFERSSGIKVNIEQYQESQLSTKLATEFASRLLDRGPVHDASPPGRQDVLQERLVQGPWAPTISRTSRRTPSAS